MISLHQVEFVGVPLGGSDDVQKIRNALEWDDDPTTKIIARIETAEQLKQVFDIIDAADGILVSRGALGGAITPQKVISPIISC